MSGSSIQFCLTVNPTSEAGPFGYLQTEHQHHATETAGVEGSQHLETTLTDSAAPPTRRRRDPCSRRTTMLVEPCSTITVEDSVEERSKTSSKKNLVESFLESVMVTVSEESCLSDHSADSSNNKNKKRKIAQKRQLFEQKQGTVPNKSSSRETKHRPPQYRSCDLKHESGGVATTHATRWCLRAPTRKHLKPVDVESAQHPHSATPATRSHGENPPQQLDKATDRTQQQMERGKRHRVATDFFDPVPVSRAAKSQIFRAAQQEREKNRVRKVDRRSSKDLSSCCRPIRNCTRRSCNLRVVFADEEEESYSNDDDQHVLEEEESHPRLEGSRRNGSNNRAATRSTLRKAAPTTSVAEVAIEGNVKRRLRSSQLPQGDAGNGKKAHRLRDQQQQQQRHDEVEPTTAIVPQPLTVNHAVSLDLLLTGYERLARAGRVEPVRFGTNFSTAQAACARKLKELCNKHPDDVEDLEVIEDIKEYKRSLRVFKYFEDQEKLALEEEYEEVVAAWRRRGAGRRKPNHEQVEEANLLHRPLVFSQIRRIPTRHSQCTKPCGLCRTPVAAPAGVVVVDALVPRIRQIDIDDEEDADDGQSQMRNCTAEPTGRVSTRSADLTLKVQMTRSQLRELQHSLTFVDEYASGLLT